MFTCCVRMLRSPEDEDNMDNDFRWKKGQTNRTYSQGGNYDLRPPIFYIESGDSTDADLKRYDISDVNGVMTSKQKLDPNSQLQRKSKLHNEKLPSFSALDRTKRPRIRNEETVMEEDNSSLGYEPLTFETFRSASPPLAVIAPLSNPKIHPHTNLAPGQKITNPHSSQKTRRQKNGKVDVKSNTSFDQERGKSSNVHRDSQQPRLPKLTHQISISKEGAVTFQCKDMTNEGLTNKGYCSDDEVSDLPRSSPSSVDDLPTPNPRHTSLSRSVQRPNTLLLLPQSGHHSPSPSRNSASTVLDESSSAFDTDTFSQTTRSRQLEDPISRTRGCINGGFNVHDSSLHDNTSVGSDKNYALGGMKEGRNDAVSDTKYVPSSEAKNENRIHELIPPSAVKKIPPKKPKRKNPPSNVSTAASRDALAKCLTSNGVTSSESARHSDADPQVDTSTASSLDVITCVSSKGVMSSDHEDHIEADLRHDDDDDVFEADDVVLLMPPQCFMDHDFAGFDGFDEVNGSLV